MTRATSIARLTTIICALSGAVSVELEAQDTRTASSFVDVKWGAGCSVENRCTLAKGDTAAVLYLTSVMRTLETLDSLFVRLPAGLRIELGKCNSPSAFYSPDTRVITICVELYSVLHREMRAAFADVPEYQNPTVIYNVTMLAADFMFLHELSHALIHIWQIPITGNEEEASDQFAAWVTLRSDNIGRLPMASIAYRRLAIPGRVAEALGAVRPYGTIHPNMYERELNLGCWATGAGYPGLRFDRLPASRQAQCDEEWARINRSWSALLRSNLRSR